MVSLTKSFKNVVRRGLNVPSTVVVCHFVATPFKLDTVRAIVVLLWLNGLVPSPDFESSHIFSCQTYESGQFGLPNVCSYSLLTFVCTVLFITLQVKVTRLEHVKLCLGKGSFLETSLPLKRVLILTTHTWVSVKPFCSEAFLDKFGHLAKTRKTCIVKQLFFTRIA